MGWEDTRCPDCGNPNGEHAAFCPTGHIVWSWPDENKAPTSSANTTGSAAVGNPPAEYPTTGYPIVTTTSPRGSRLRKIRGAR